MDAVLRKLGLGRTISSDRQAVEQYASRNDLSPIGVTTAGGMPLIAFGGGRAGAMGATPLDREVGFIAQTGPWKEGFTEGGNYDQRASIAEAHRQLKAEQARLGLSDEEFERQLVLQQELTVVADKARRDGVKLFSDVVQALPPRQKAEALAQMAGMEPQELETFVTGLGLLAKSPVTGQSPPSVLVDHKTGETRQIGGPAPTPQAAPAPQVSSTTPATEPVVTTPATEPVVTAPATEPVVTAPANTDEPGWWSRGVPVIQDQEWGRGITRQQAAGWTAAGAGAIAGVIGLADLLADRGTQQQDYNAYAAQQAAAHAY
jgi:hypothetical protein